MNNFHLETIHIHWFRHSRNECDTAAEDIGVTINVIALEKQIIIFYKQ